MKTLKSKQNKKSKLTSKVLQAAVVTGVLGTVALANAESVYGHGYVESPMSRSFRASRASGQMGWTAANQLYGSIINEPQSVEGPGSLPNSANASWWNTRRPADGTFASGGVGRFNQLNTVTGWDFAEINPGINEFTWRFTAPHATSHFKYYMTKSEWDPSRPLTELTHADLELIEFIDYNRMSGGQLGTSRTHEVNIPENRSGHHVVLAVWDVFDTAAAFYQAIDVYVVNDGIVVPEVPEPEVVDPEVVDPEVVDPEVVDPETVWGGSITWVTRPDADKNLTGESSIEVSRDFLDRHGRSVINLILRDENNRIMDLTNYDVIFSTEGVLGNSTTTPEWQERGHVHFPILASGKTTVSLQHKATGNVEAILTFVITSEDEYPEWTPNQTWQQGDRVTYNGKVYESRFDFWCAGGPSWTPELATALWMLIG